MRIKTNIGSALLGTLAFAVGGVTLAMGSLKLNTHLLNKVKTKSVELSEENLKETVQRILSDETRCNENLNPNQNPALDPANITKLKRKDNGGTIIEVGDFKDGDINIVGMKLTEPDPDNSNRQTFYLYYTKPALGAKQKRTDDDCESGENGNKQGCYYLSCEIIDSSNGCQVLLNGCSFPDDNSQSNSFSCETDQVLNNKKSCVPLQSKLLKSINVGGIDQNYFYGFTGLELNQDGKIQATRIKMSKVCPKGKYPRGGVYFDDEHFINYVFCEIRCTGGSTPTGDDRCQCSSSNAPKYSKGACRSCPEVISGSIWSTTEKDCICQHGKEPNQNNECACPSHKPNIWNGFCISCKGGSSWDNNNNICVCPDGKRWGYSNYDLSENGCTCPSNKPHIYNNKCIRCPSGATWDGSNCICSHGRNWNSQNNTCNCPSNKLHYYSGRCNRCPQNKPHIYNNKCIRCPSDATWDGSNCICSHGRNWDFRHRSYNRCECPINKPHYHHQACHGCSSNYFYSERCNVCPFNRRHHILGRFCHRCPSNRYHYHNNQCNKCSSSKPNYYRNHCWKCPENRILVYNDECFQCPRTAPHYRDGKCCPSAQGACCMPGYHLNSRGGCQRNDDGRWCREEGRHLSNNICCKNGYHYTNGICCPDEYIYSNGKCCPRNYYYNSRVDACCENGTVFSNGSCCSPGYTFDRDSGVCFRNSQ